MLKHRLQQANPDGGAGGANPNPGAANAEWFPAEHKDFVTNKGWKSPADVITSAINLEKLIGADKAGRTVIMPKDDKDAEGIKAFRARLGVPEKVEDYKLPVPEGDDGKFSAQVAQWFHAAGVPREAAVAIATNWNDFFGKMLKDEEAAAQAESQSQLTKLKGEWGGEFDKNSEFAKRFMRNSGWSDDEVSLFERTFGTASMLKKFHAFGSKFQETPLAGGGDGGGGGSFSMTKQAAQSKLDEIRAARTAGTITDAQWKNGKQAEFEQLAQIIAGS